MNGQSVEQEEVGRRARSLGSYLRGSTGPRHLGGTPNKLRTKGWTGLEAGTSPQRCTEALSTLPWIAVKGMRLSWPDPCCSGPPAVNAVLPCECSMAPFLAVACVDDHREGPVRSDQRGSRHCAGHMHERRDQFDWSYSRPFFRCYCPMSRLLDPAVTLRSDMDVQARSTCTHVLALSTISRQRDPCGAVACAAGGSERT